MAESYDFDDELFESDKEDNSFDPRSIQRYLRVHNNDEESIFDTFDNNQNPTPYVDDVMMRDDGDVVHILPGKGRGATREYYTKKASPEIPYIDNIPKLIRKVNSSGYFVDFEKLSRAFNDKVKGYNSRYKCSQTYPWTPSTSSRLTSESSSSGTTTSVLRLGTTKTDGTEPADKSLPLSEMFIKIEKKKKQWLNRQVQRQNIENVKAFQRLLEEDQMESEPPVRFSRGSTSSFVDEPSWEKRISTLPRYSWNTNSSLDISSTEDSPSVE